MNDHKNRDKPRGKDSARRSKSTDKRSPTGGRDAGRGKEAGESKFPKRPDFKKTQPPRSKDRPEFKKLQPPQSKDRPEFKKPQPPRSGDRPDDDASGPRSRKPYDKRHGAVKYERDAETPPFKSKYQKGPAARKPYRGGAGSSDFGPRTDKKASDDTIRLNKYLANSGLSSRREADELIRSGLVQINGKVVTEMGVKVKPDDTVTYAGEKVKPEKPVYLLLNKPKDYITTAKDPQNRQTVMQLLRGLGNHRVFPVGRLDRHTTGLLMFTNDGDLAKKLTHPKHGVKKLYHVFLDKNCKPEHMHQLVEGVELEDGVMAVDVVSYVADAKDKSQVGVEIHSGKNRIVRRLFESLGYKVIKLDRVVFGGLTKKDLARGKWRYLTEQELNNLKML